MDDTLGSNLRNLGSLLLGDGLQTIALNQKDLDGMDPPFISTEL